MRRRQEDDAPGPRGQALEDRRNRGRGGGPEEEDRADALQRVVERFGRRQIARADLDRGGKSRRKGRSPEFLMARAVISDADPSETHTQTSSDPSAGPSDAIS